MRRIALLMLCALAGCAWTFDTEDDWLPLVGTPLDLEAAPKIDTGVLYEGLFHFAADGRVWVIDPQVYDEQGPRDSTLRSLEIPSQKVSFPFGAQVTRDGIVTVTPLEPVPTTRFQLELAFKKLPVPSACRHSQCPLRKRRALACW